MAEVNCGRGHIYDSKLYASCPYCNGGGYTIDFGGGSDIQKTAPLSGYGSGPRLEPDSGIGGIGHTEPLSQLNPVSGGGGSEISKTVPLRAPAGQEADDVQKTMPLFAGQHKYDPVVGWLVCIDGPAKGQDFRLLARVNSVGRSKKNVVCVEKATDISGENQFKVAYDAKHNEFTVIPGENITNPNYLNGSALYTPNLLHAYDVIEAGSSQFLFIPLCNDRFTWDGAAPAGENK